MDVCVIFSFVPGIISPIFNPPAILTWPNFLAPDNLESNLLLLSAIKSVTFAAGLFIKFNGNIPSPIPFDFGTNWLTLFCTSEPPPASFVSLASKIDERSFLLN